MQTDVSSCGTCSRLYTKVWQCDQKGKPVIIIIMFSKSNAICNKYNRTIKRIRKKMEN